MAGHTELGGVEGFEVTGTAQKQAWADKVMPPVERVEPGLWSIPVPLPDSPLRYVLVYGLELADGIALVDAGWDTEEAWSALVAGLGTAGYAPADVRAVLVTHIHPDHYGLAGRVREASGAWIALHPADAEVLPTRYRQPEALLASMRDFLVRCGVPQGPVDELGSASMPIRGLVFDALPDVLLEDGDTVDIPGWDLRAIWTPGHSPGHLCFHAPERRLLLSGDHVLPRITPNISMHVQQRDSPLADFLDSLVKISTLDVDEVLPAHEYRFRGLAARAAQMRDHHEDRLDEVHSLLVDHPGASAWEVTLRLTWSRPWEQIQGFMRRAALGETVAHLVVLETRGRVRRHGDQPERWEAVAG